MLLILVSIPFISIVPSHTLVPLTFIKAPPDMPDPERLKSSSINIRGALSSSNWAKSLTIIPFTGVPAPCAFCRFNIPAYTVVIPSNVFLPESINFPAPALNKLLAAPLITPDIVNVPLTVIDASAGKTNGQDINAVPEISLIATPAFPAIVKIPGPEIIPPGMSVIVEHVPSTFI